MVNVNFNFNNFIACMRVIHVHNYVQVVHIVSIVLLLKLQYIANDFPLKCLTTDHEHAIAILKITQMYTPMYTVVAKVLCVAIIHMLVYIILCVRKL